MFFQKGYRAREAAAAARRRQQIVPSEIREARAAILWAKEKGVAVEAEPVALTQAEIDAAEAAKKAAADAANTPPPATEAVTEVDAEIGNDQSDAETGGEDQSEGTEGEPAPAADAPATEGTEDAPAEKSAAQSKKSKKKK